MNRAYLDNNATTRPLDAVVAAVGESMAAAYANPSSVHQFGQSVRHRVECARGQVAALLNAKPREIVFTSGGTESINHAVRGMLSRQRDRRKLVTTAVEHSAVKRLGEQLAREGFEVVETRVDGQGRLDLAALETALDENAGLLSVLWANNETGVLFDVAAIAELARERGVPIHVDAVQAAGKVPIDVERLPVDLLSVSAHKFHGPKGVGALYLRRRAKPAALIVGGRQERDHRGGTENVPGIVGMGVAAAAAVEHLAGGAERVAGLRDRFEAAVCAAVPYAEVVGGEADRIGNTSNIAFRGVQAEALLLLLSEHGICASAGSACSSGSLEPSHVLTAMGIDEELAHGAIRFSLSRLTTDDEIEYAIATIPKLVGRLAAMNA